MTDQLEEHLREAFAERASQVDPAARARLRAFDYSARRRRFGLAPRLGAAGVAAVGAATAVVVLSSGAAPAFAGWRATPTTPAPGQVAQAQQACGSGLGSPVLTDTRGPYTLSLYSDGSGNYVCLAGNGISAEWSSSPAGGATVAPAQIELSGAGLRDAAGNSLTLVDGQVGADVTAVTIDRSDGTSVQATVTGGWYLAWWPGVESATQAEVTTASGTSDQSFPQQAPAAPSCPAGGRCSSGYSFGSGYGSSGGGGASTTSMQSGAGSVSQTGGTSGPPAGAVGNSGQ